MELGQRRGGRAFNPGRVQPGPPYHSRTSKPFHHQPIDREKVKIHLLVVQAKPAGERNAKNPKTFGSEIDEIFSSKKRKKPETEDKVAENKAHMSMTTKKKSHAKNKPTKDIKGPLDIPAGQRKRTKDGLVVYTEEELGFGKSDAGGTRLCPFDCDCCF